MGEKKRRVLAWVSGGAASVVAAKLAIAKYGHDRVLLVRCETGNEDEDNARFERDASAWLGKETTILKAEKFDNVVDCWIKRKFMAGPNGAPCTTHMKVEPRLAFQHPTDIHVFGYTEDRADVARFEKLRETYFELTVEAPLIDVRVSKASALAIVERAGLTLPRSYAMGFPNANCLQTGCVKATSPDYWSLFRARFPERFERMAALSRQIGARLVRINDERRFLDALPVDWPMLSPIAPSCDFLCAIAEDEILSPGPDKGRGE